MEENYNYDNNVKITGSAYEDEIINEGSKVTINARGGDDYIIDNGNFNSINGGDGDDVIELGEYVDSTTITGGDGDDMIYFNGGNITVTDYEEGDTIALFQTGSSYYSASELSSMITYEQGYYDDLNVYFGDEIGSIYFENVKDIHYITFLDSGGEVVPILPNGLSFDYDAGTLYVYSDYEGYEIDTYLFSEYGFEITNIDASEYSTYDGLYIYFGEAFENYIYGGNGDDTIEVSSAAGTTVSGGYGANTFILNYGNLTITDYAEGDTIKIALEGITAEDMYIDDEGGIQIGEYSYIYLENIEDYENVTFVDVDGNIIDFPESDDDTIVGTNGADTLTNSSGYYRIDALAGNDSIYNSGENVTIDAGEGDDTITVYYSDYNSVNGGAGNDVIQIEGNSSWSWNPTVKGGTGNDTIYGNGISSYGALYQYANGDGNDVIYNLSTTDTIHITSGNISSSVASGNDVILTVGTGTMTLKDAASKTIYLKIGTAAANSVTLPASLNPYYILGTSGADNINNTLNNATIDALAGNDSIDNFGASVKIYAGDGADTIYSEDNYSTVDGGTGNDIIHVDGLSNIVNGGEGADHIIVYDGAKNTTINAGAGNDTVEGIGTLGSAVINLGAGNDSVKVFSNEVYATINADSGNNTIAMGGQKILINGGSDADSIHFYTSASSVTAYGGAGNDTLEADARSGRLT